jgi:hypothetical protein
MNKQEIFDKVARHLLRQGEKSSSHGDQMDCMYRGPGKLKCAIGCLIPDKFYDYDIEGRTIGDDKLDDVLKHCGIRLYVNGTPTSTNMMLDDLQNTHDSCGVDKWRGKLMGIAHRYDVNTKAMPVVVG